MNPDQSNPETSLLPALVSCGGPPTVPPQVEIWPEPAEGPVLLNQVASTFGRYLVLPPGAADTLALIIAHFHCFDAFMHTPRLSFQAMEKGCGKTTALEVAACLAPGPCVAENMSTAVLYRLAGMRGRTLLLDEVDTWVLKDDLLRGLLNAGHRRGGQVWRYEKPHGPRSYDVFGPVVLAGIGALPDTLQDRSIVIRLTRAKPGEIQVRFDSRRTATEDQLRARLARWAHDHVESLDKADPVLPDNAHILRLQTRDITLSASQVPKEFVKCAAFGIALTGYDLLVFVLCYRATALVLNPRPKLVRQNRPGQPVHSHAKILKPAQVNVCADFPSRHHA